MIVDAPSIADIRAARERLASSVRVTPVIALPLSELDSTWPSDSTALLKLELFQVTGTFKVRGALNGMLDLSGEQKRRGVTAVSAGNHAVAVAYAARALGISATVVMPKSANPARVQLARDYGADIEFAENGGAAFDRVMEIEAEQGRTFIHPFEGPGPVTGAATVGLEWLEQCGEIDVAVIACGGGGLLGGVAAAMKQLSPKIQLFGVEPKGADAMFRSFDAGEPVSLPAVATIADSLAPPMTTPYTLAVCRRFVEQIARVSDDEIRNAMSVLFRSLKLAVEPAGATALAGVLGPLRELLRGKRRIGILICGSNIDPRTYCSQLPGVN